MQILNGTLVLTLLALTACGPKDSEHSAHSGATVAALESSSSIETVDGVTTVRFSGGDRMQYSLTEFTVKSGDTVRLVFSNNGKMPKASMGHNVVILGQNVDANLFAGAASKARATDFIPVSDTASMVAHTKLLGPDEEDTIEFIAPAPGDYTYLCSFPAHFFAGMRGVMTVVAESSVH